MIKKLKNNNADRNLFMSKRNISNPEPVANSQRLVVDEIFDNGTVRLLRANRIASAADSDISISAWAEEEEDFLDAWLVEAFVGFPSQRKLQEGDVFFVVDGSKLNGQYKPIPRETARSIHLLKPWDESREFARTEIKKEFSKLSAAKISKEDKRKLNELFKRVDKKFKTDNPHSRKNGGV